MARTFTIQFDFENDVYTAVISQVKDSVCIYIPDQSLHYILPDGRFTYSLSQNMDIMVEPITPIQKLVMNIVAALESQTAGLP
jgi:hypothetical protein